MSLVRKQCVAVQEKIQPLFKQAFESAGDNQLTIGGFSKHGAMKSGFAVLALWCGGLLLPALAAPSDTVLRERFLQAEKKIHKVPLSQAEKMLRDLQPIH